ncbi:ephrin type-B receptor 2-like protein [Labeo rohita]|uniref:Ephrin type-B receptor 2-like protein n=1 Tax=Labeo rohita TaxID=84645 RepID=A0A498M946_LABRO|nr:ephrin type-B receptor 2-like protein [Labeo rohita]
MSVAQKNSVQEQNHQSSQYNKRVKGLPLAIGDQVLVANKGCRGKRKLADRWEPVVYTVVASKPSIHVYRISDRAGNERTVHRNLLLQVNFLPLPNTESDGYGRQDARSPTCSVSPQSDPTCSGGLTAQTHSDACSYAAEIEPAEDADDDQNDAEELSQADSMSNISNVATCDDDRTASWVHSQLPSQQEPNSRFAVPVADDNTVAGAGSNEVLLEERFRENAKMYAAENLYDMLDDLINARGHPCQKKACLSRAAAFTHISLL